MHSLQAWHTKGLPCFRGKGCSPKDEWIGRQCLQTHEDSRGMWSPAWLRFQAVIDEVLHGLGGMLRHPGAKIVMSVSKKDASSS